MFLRALIIAGTGFWLAACGAAQTSPIHGGSGAPLYILVDQFGYQPEGTKIAILRRPLDAPANKSDLTPGDTIRVIDANNGETVYEAAPVDRSEGQIDPQSGDLVWTMDFTALRRPGWYYIYDPSTGLVSESFDIAADIYGPVRKAALKAFYYQRAGIEKAPPFADLRWADSASHLQDREARLYSAPRNRTMARDLSGGWYDAGDYNQYTNWTARAVKVLLHAYLENPEAWSDDIGIPESGNGVPDILDEVRWGLDWLIKMQNANGSVLSILDRDHASPPSAATGRSLYGTKSSAAAVSTGGAFALAAIVLNPHDPAYADVLSAKADAAYAWALDNPDIIFRNNERRSGTEGLGAGQQEPEEAERQALFLEAALYLDLIRTDGSNEVSLPDFSKRRISEVSGTPYDLPLISAILLHRRSGPKEGAISQLVDTAFQNGFLIAPEGGLETPYFIGTRASFWDVHWGSNGIVARQGVLDHLRMRGAPESFLHYLHGVNPVGEVFLSNMFEFGALYSADEIYHAWFPHGDRKWGKVSMSEQGPLPGFLVGGPNQYYQLNACCPESCGNRTANAQCQLEGPPLNQPPLRSYLDFSDGWPRDSWQVSEPSISYQADYLRLLGYYAD